MSDRYDLSVILPVHNEAGGIEDFLTRLDSVLRHEGLLYEIICVENGSTDRSYDILLKLTKRLSTLCLVRSTVGWGNAVRKGIEFASARYICYLVSDGQVDSATIPILYREIVAKDLVMIKGFRKNRENILRRIVSLVYNILPRLFFGLRSHDINGTPKLIRSDIVKSMVFTAPNIAFDLELLLALHTKKYPWIEVPIEGKRRVWGKSSTTMKTMLEMLGAIFQFRFFPKK